MKRKYSDVGQYLSISTTVYFTAYRWRNILCVDRKYGAIRIIGIEKQETLKSKTLWSVEGNLKQSI